MAVESGSYTPEQIARRRAIAEALIAPGKTRQITHWAEGLDELGKGALGGHLMRRVDEQERASEEGLNRAYMNFLQPQASSPAAGAPVGNAGASPMGKLPAMGSRVYDQSEFNPLDAAVATPKELAAGVPAPPQYASLIGKAAVDNDIPPQLLAAQLKQESGFNPNAVSPAGATGISQFMPATAREMGVTDPRDPTQAIPAGARYLRQNIDKFGGSVPLGLAAYNAGPGRVERSGGDISRLPAETQGYVANIAGQNPVAASLSGAGAQPQNNTQAKIAAMLSSQNPGERKLGRSLAQTYIAQNAKGDQPTDEIKEYNLAKSQGFTGSFVDFKTQLKKAGATNVTTNVENKGESAFSTEAGKVQAKRFDELAAEGPKARQMVSDVQTLSELGKQIGTGKEAETKAALGPYAEALGFKIDKLSEIQAFDAIVARVAPNLRVPGSGAQSDYELKNFLKSIPSIGNTPEGNALVAKTMEGLYQNKITAAEIGAKALSGELTRPQAEKMLRELPDPMKDWREAQKAVQDKKSVEPDKAAVAAEMRRRGLLK